jgi:hypothetical protein
MPESEIRAYTPSGFATTISNSREEMRSGNH